MKTLILTTLFLGSSFLLSAQNCCEMPSGKAFAMLAEDGQFTSSHTYNIHEPQLTKDGTMITFKVDDDNPANGYIINADAKSNKYLFVFQEWWGLNAHINKESEKYFEALGGDVNVLAIDLYDGEKATTSAHAGALMKSREDDRLRAIIDGAYTYAGEAAEVATVGWCFGGGWSLQAAIAGGDQAKACVMYYGMPEKDPNRLEKLQAPVLGIFAEKDGWINREMVDPFDDRMRALEKDITVKWYDAVHAFANPSNEEYDAKKAADAFSKSVAHIQLHL